MFLCSLYSAPSKTASNMNKLLAFGTFGALSTMGVSAFVFAQEKEETPVEVEVKSAEEEKPKKEPLPLEPPPTFNLEDEDDENDPDLKEYNPWFRGVKEISVFLDKDSIQLLEDQFPQIYKRRYLDFPHSWQPLDMLTVSLWC